MRRRFFLPIMAGVVAIGLGAWFFAAEPETFSTNLRGAICSGSERLALAGATDFDWDTVVILTPGSDPRAAEKALGLPFADYLVKADAETDALIFARDRRIAHVVQHPRKDGDFAVSAAGVPFTRASAIFDIRRRTASCDYALLVPKPAD